jgi:hypothetical protein
MLVFFILLVTCIVGNWVLFHAPTTQLQPQKFLYRCIIQERFLTSKAVLPKLALSISVSPTWTIIYVKRQT